MTTTPAPAQRLVAVRLHVAHHADAVALAGLVALAALLVPLTWGTWGDPLRDTGYDLVAGFRVADGQLPYADFTYSSGPLAPLLYGLAAVLGGSTLGPAVALGLVLAGIAVALTYALGRALAGPVGGFLAGGIALGVALAPTNMSFVLPHSLSATLAVVTSLGFLVALERHGRGSRAALAVAGACAGLTALTRPEFVLAVWLAAGAWLALALWRRRAGLREVALLAGPALAIPALVYGLFLTRVPLGELLWENLYPRDELAAAGNAVLKIHAPLTAGSFAELAGRLGIYAAGVGALLVLAAVLGGRGRLARWALGATAVGGIAVLAASAARPETLRYGLEFAYGWIPAAAILAAVALAWRSLRRRDLAGRWSATAQLELAATIVLAVLAAKVYAAFLVHTPRPQPAVYAVPVAAALLARLHLRTLPGLLRAEGARTAAAGLGAAWLAFLAVAGVGLVANDGAAESAVVRGPGGSLAMAPAEAAVYRQALAAIEERTAPGEPILVAPQQTMLHVLSGRPGALPQLSLLPGALPTAADEQAAIDALEAADVRLAVIDGRAFTEYGHESFGVSFDRLLAGWLEARFDHQASLGGEPGGLSIDLWGRTAE
ncbi:MAG: hypothetical protein R3C15_00690 [Thermoleophilia bacterium]